ncbi:protein S100-G-like [Anomaloglossus baeobatrachus]
MASPPQLPGVVLLVLGLCCAAVICQIPKTQVLGLEKGLQLLLHSYYQYAKQEGNPDTVNSNELRNYLKKEMPSFLVGKGPDAVEKTLSSLDQDKDGELSHCEFFKLQVQFLMASYQASNMAYV